MSAAKPTVNQRLFDCIESLVPGLRSVSGRVLFAPAKGPVDLSTYVAVSHAEDGSLVVEIAEDNPVKTRRSEGCIRLRVDPDARFAEVIEIEWEFGFAVVYGDGRVHPRRPQINRFAANWLQSLASFGVRVRPLDCVET